MEGFTTKVIHTKPLKKDAQGALRYPVYDSASFEFESAEDIAGAFAGSKPAHAYSRITNPTVEYLETQIKSVTNAVGVIALASGMAAISNVVIGLCSTNDNVVTTKNLFGNSLSLFRNTLGPWGLKTKFADFKDIDSVKNSIDDNTRIIYLETITNPQLEVADIEAVGKIAKEAGVVLVVDSTITPISFGNLKKFGVDIEVVSNTKYISGGATSVGGLIIDYGTYKWSKHPRFITDYKKFGPFAFLRKLRKTIYRDLGACLSPHSSYLQSLGLETFKLRVEKTCQNSKIIADKLDEDPRILSVNYPGLKSSTNEIAKKQFNGLYGGILTFDLDSKENCYVLLNSLKLIRRSTNLNDNKTLIIHPASTIFCEYSQEERESMGVRDTTIRLSVGIEDVNDLLADLNQALEVIDA